MRSLLFPLQGESLLRICNIRWHIWKLKTLSKVMARWSQLNLVDRNMVYSKERKKTQDSTYCWCDATNEQNVSEIKHRLKANISIHCRNRNHLVRFHFMQLYDFVCCTSAVVSIADRFSYNSCFFCCSSSSFSGFVFFCRHQLICAL